MRDRPALDLFLISWLVLFLELACIRWFPSHVLFLTFFTNTVLLACFVGMSIGCLVARRPGRLINLTPCMLALSIAAGLMIDLNSVYLSALFDVGNQANPDVVFFGTEVGLKRETPFTIPIEVVGGAFFILIAILMMGPGQEMGRAFNRVSNRTTAYSANLLGSLVGIGMFAGCSYLQLPPLVWFGACAVVIAYLFARKGPDSSSSAETPPKSKRLLFVWLGLALVLTAFTSGIFPGWGGRLTTWSPYYRIDYIPKVKQIITNQLSHQIIEPRDELTSAPYALPYLFHRDLKKEDGTAAWGDFKRILIIGAGSGNDVARSLRWAAPDAKIDAVEIDPVIQSIGVAHHPDEPFKDPRVNVYLNDGRNFLRDAQAETYDLVIFALIDSLVLQSGYSNIRLESYLFTLESFQGVRRVLKPTGVFAIYNFFRQGWIIARIRDQLRLAFAGSDPAAMTARDHIPLDLYEPTGFTIFFAGGEEVIAPLRTAFRNPSLYFWYPWLTGVSTDSSACFSSIPPAERPPASQHPCKLPERDSSGQIVRDSNGYIVWKTPEPEWLGLRLATIEETKGGTIATDDWPFLYTRNLVIPGLTWRGVILTLVLSIGLWFAFGGPKALSNSGTDSNALRPDWDMMLRCFFLGVGFMLVETKAVVQMALLFGGTWMVNSVVFAAILAMSLAGNLYAGKMKPKRLAPYYIGLFATLGIGLAVPTSEFLGRDPIQILKACGLVFAPIAFAGVIFATSFRRTEQPDRVFGANVAGALVGGLSENLSVLLGFRLLLCVAIGFYFLSAIFGNREVPASEAEKGE
jgi:SAM-dependent methyltransferase